MYRFRIARAIAFCSFRFLPILLQSELQPDEGKNNESHTNTKWILLQNKTKKRTTEATTTAAETHSVHVSIGTFIKMVRLFVI